MGSFLPTPARRAAARVAPFLLACMVLGCASTRFDALVLRSDDARERRWAEEIVPTLLVGDAVWLQAPGAGRKFLAILTEPKKPRGAIVLVHGLGVNPDYGVIGSLRTQLAD